MIRVQGSVINLLHYYCKRCKLYSTCLTCNSSGAIFIHYILGQCQFCHEVCQLTIHMCVPLNCHVMCNAKLQFIHMTVSMLHTTAPDIPTSSGSAVNSAGTGMYSSPTAISTSGML